MAQIPNGRLVKGRYKPICSDCAMYFETTVPLRILPFFGCQCKVLLQILGRRDSNQPKPYRTSISHEQFVKFLPLGIFLVTFSDNDWGV